MEAPSCWQWRGWRGRRDATEDHAMPPSSASLPAPEPSCSPIPPVPAPVHEEQPAPRVVWEDGGGTGSAPWVRLTAIDWTDGAPPTYQVEVARGMSWWAPGDGVLWVPATELDRAQMFFALAAAVDERGARREAGGQRA